VLEEHLRRQLGERLRERAGANRSMNLGPSRTESISVHSLDFEKWPNMIGPAATDSRTLALTAGLAS